MCVCVCDVCVCKRVRVYSLKTSRPPFSVWWQQWSRLTTSPLHGGSTDLPWTDTSQLALPPQAHRGCYSGTRLLLAPEQRQTRKTRQNVSQIAQSVARKSEAKIPTLQDSMFDTLRVLDSSNERTLSSSVDWQHPIFSGGRTSCDREFAHVVNHVRLRCEMLWTKNEEWYRGVINEGQYNYAY